MKDIEQRYTNISELRTINEEDSKPKLSGYAVVWNALSTDLGGFKERVKKGTFTRTLQETDDIKILFNHNTDHVLGSTKAKTLFVEERAKGLYFENELPDTQFARDLAVSVDRGDIDGVSFGFKITKDDWDRSEENNDVIRTVKEASLVEISPCTFPAYKSSSVSMRSFEKFKEQSEGAVAPNSDIINRSELLLDGIDVRLQNLKNKIKGKK